MAKVSRQAAANWRVRFRDFPAPIVELRSGPVFRLSDVQHWLKKRRRILATVLSTINLKGGVGKTTVTVALAEMLSLRHHARVLVVDLDPQTNATTVLIGEKKWAALNIKGYTLARLFQDALEEDPQKRQFDLEKAIQKNASPVDEVRRVDLLPSSLNLIDVQDRLASMPVGRYYSNAPTEILNRALKPVLDKYDYIVIDCPPNLGIITFNGLRLSDGYIIPTIPDVLSTYGIPQIVSRVAAFAHELNQPIEPLGIVISKYREQSDVHRRTVRELRRAGDAPVFDTVIPEANAISASAENAGFSTLRQKYSYGNRYDLFADLSDEIVKAAAT